MVTPQVSIAQKIPTGATHNKVFNATGTLRPKRGAGPLAAVVQARKVGTTKVYEFGVRALASKTGYNPIRSSVKLPSAGTWVVHFYYPEDATNARTATKWVRVNVK